MKFMERQGGYNLREQIHLKKLKIRTTLKSMSITIGGVSLWNGLDQVLKHCTNTTKFKKLYKNTLLKGYEEEER